MIQEKKSSYDDANISCGSGFDNTFCKLYTRGGPVINAFSVEWTSYLQNDVQWMVWNKAWFET